MARSRALWSFRRLARPPDCTQDHTPSRTGSLRESTAWRSHPAAARPVRWQSIPRLWSRQRGDHRPAPGGSSTWGPAEPVVRCERVVGLPAGAQRRVGQQASPPLPEAITDAQAQRLAVPAAALMNESGLVIQGTNGWTEVGASTGLLEALKKAKSKNQLVDSVTLGADGSWILVKAKGREWTSSGGAPREGGRPAGPVRRAGARRRLGGRDLARVGAAVTQVDPGCFRAGTRGRTRC